MSEPDVNLAPRPGWVSVQSGYPPRDVNCLVTNGREFAIGTWRPQMNAWDTATHMPAPPTLWASLDAIDRLLGGPAEPMPLSAADRDFLVMAAPHCDVARRILSAHAWRIGRLAGLISESGWEILPRTEEIVSSD